MREMKSVKKRTRKDNEAVKEAAHKENYKQTSKAKVTKLSNKELFSVNMSKTGLAQKRQKLSADRFKSKKHVISAVETEIIKKIKAKNENKVKNNQVGEMTGMPIVDPMSNLWSGEPAYSKMDTKL
jgi:hypothetical protein